MEPNEALENWRQWLVQRLERLNTFCPAILVEDYDHEKMLAKVRPLAKRESDSTAEPPVIENVPILTYKNEWALHRFPLPKDTVVMLGYVQRAVDRIMDTLTPVFPSFKRRHHYKDAIVIMPYFPFFEGCQRPAPAAYKDDDLLHYNRETGENMRALRDGRQWLDSTKVRLGRNPARPVAAIGDLTICLCTGCLTQIITGSPHVEET